MVFFYTVKSLVKAYSTASMVRKQPSQGWRARGGSTATSTALRPTATAVPETGRPTSRYCPPWADRRIRRQYNPHVEGLSTSDVRHADLNLAVCFTSPVPLLLPQYRQQRYSRLPTPKESARPLPRSGPSGLMADRSSGELIRWNKTRVGFSGLRWREQHDRATEANSVGA
jgi:hypothetical protein